MTRTMFQPVTGAHGSMVIIMCVLFHFQYSESAAQREWNRCEDWQEWACDRPSSSQKALNRSLGGYTEPGSHPGIPVFVLHRHPDAPGAQALLETLHDLGLTDITFVPAMGTPSNIMDWMETLDVDVARNLILDTFTSKQHTVSQDLIYAAMTDGVGYDADDRLAEAVEATMAATNWIALLRGSIGIEMFLLLCDDGFGGWESTPRAFGALHLLLLDIPEDADVLLLDWSQEECSEIHCHSRHPSFVRVHSPLHFSAMLWTAKGIRKVEPFINPIWTSVHEMLATAVMGKDLVAYGVKPADLIFARHAGSAMLCRSVPECITPTTRRQEGVVELELILLYPAQNLLLPQPHTRVEVLVRCRADNFDCTKRSKSVHFLVDGQIVESHQTLLLASSGLVFSGDGEYEIGVQVQMKGHEGRQLRTTITVDSSAKPHGDGRSLLVCPKVEHRLCDSTNKTACGEHGRCTRGVCVCAADFVGDLCDIDLSSYSAPPHRHLPLSDPATDPSTCVRNEERNREAERFQDYMADVFDHSFPDTHPLVFENQHDGLGLGAQLIFAADALAYGARAGKNVRWTIPDSVYTQFDSCDSSDKSVPLFACFFAPLYPDNGHLCRQPELYVPSEQRNHPMKDFPHLGSWALLSQVVALLTRPTRRLARALVRVKQAIGFRDDLVGVHVRHGDACFADWCRSGSCNPIADVAAAVSEMLGRYPEARGVFLATDDPDTGDQLRSALPGVLVVTNDNVDRSVLGGRFSLAKRVLWGHIDRRYATESIVLDMALLGECKYLVGNLRSSVSRVAVHMMAARLGYVPPFISLHPGYQTRRRDARQVVHAQQAVGGKTVGTKTHVLEPETESAVRKDAKIFFEKWRELQFAVDCDAVDRFWVVPIPHHIGLGAILHMITNTMRRAMYEKRMAVLDGDPLTYSNPRACPNRSLACYLLPLSSCTIADVERRFPRAQWAGDFTEAARPVVKGWAKKASIGVPYKDLLPEGLSQPYGHGFQQALMFGLLLRPTPKLAQFINEIASDIQLPSAAQRRPPVLAGPHSPPLMRRCIAVHFRNLRGHEKFNGRKHSAEIFHLQLDLLSGWLGIDSVYFASDLPAALEAFTRRHPHLVFHSMENMGLFPSTDAPGTMDVPDFLAEESKWYDDDVRDEALAMLANVYLLGSCEYFLGGVSSNLGRTSRELMSFALDGEPAPATDIDNDVPFEHEAARPGFHISCAHYESISL